VVGKCHLVTLNLKLTPWDGLVSSHSAWKLGDRGSPGHCTAHDLGPELLSSTSFLLLFSLVLSQPQSD
jgi:hypothetical protein